MGVNNKLYDRNHEDYAKSIGAKTLYVTGTLPGVLLDEEYEGRLQIHNNVGPCQAEVVAVLEGELPENYSIFCDNDTNEVVLKWPGKMVINNSLINPSLETGTLEGWDQTTVGGTGSLAVVDTHYHDGKYSAYWAGGKGLGSEGGIECFALNQTKGVITPGQRVQASVDILYNPDGGTPKGSRGQVLLYWYNEADGKIGESLGFLVKTRKFNGKWTTSTVSDKAIPGAAYVRLVAWVTANGAGHSYFDNAVWDVPDATGATVVGNINLRIKVTDSLNRVAYWEGTISVLPDYSAQVMSELPIAYWKADEVGTSILTDSSGNGYHGTYNSTGGASQGNPPLRKGGLASIQTTALGVGATIISPSSSDKLEIANKQKPWAMECIVRRTGKGGSVLAQFFGAEGTTLGGGNRFMYRWGAANNYIVWDWGSDNRNSPNNTAGQIVHAVVEMDAPTSGAPRYLNIYENGKRVYNGTVSVNNTTTWNGKICLLGTTVYPDSYAFTGQGSDFALYDHLLGPEKVKNHAIAAGLYQG